MHDYSLVNSNLNNSGEKVGDSSLVPVAKASNGGEEYRASARQRASSGALSGHMLEIYILYNERNTRYWQAPECSRASLSSA